MDDFKLGILSDNPEEHSKVRFDFEAYKNTFAILWDFVAGTLAL